MRTTLFFLFFFLCSFGAKPSEPKHEVTEPPKFNKRHAILVQIKNDEISMFINSVWDIAQFIENVYGIPLELTIAQACQESGFGTSRLCRKECNYLGIQGFKFNSKEECFLKYGDILTCLPCYVNLAPRTLEDWFNALDSCYYSGDPNYNKSLKQIIDKYLTVKP